jgi:hypothetical protein
MKYVNVYLFFINTLTRKYTYRFYTYLSNIVFFIYIYHFIKINYVNLSIDLQAMGESSRKKRCGWHSDPTTTTAGYRDLDFGNPPKAWDPVEPFAKNNKYLGTTRSPIIKRMSMDGMNLAKVNYT